MMGDEKPELAISEAQPQPRGPKSSASCAKASTEQKVTPENSKISHELAKKAAEAFLESCRKNGFNPYETLVSTETFFSMMLLSCVAQLPCRDPKRLAQEFLDTLTERTHKRVQQALQTAIDRRVP